MKLGMDSVKRIAAGAAVVATMATATVLGTAGSAAAAGSGQIQVCSNGNYASYVVFPNRGGFSTFVVNKGTCATYNILGSSTTVEPIEVRGIYNTSSNTFWVGNGQIRPSRGGNVITYGTTAAGNHWALTPSV
ncbi:hypothetical protein [Umezawaea sp. NPDC059074]|uniref:hypothetical protein n=1 Tax=Umezawaea sp. NPDC059074 TaxID=3346716 RepID=UPI0036976DC3